jgi:hypothetical protein
LAADLRVQAQTPLIVKIHHDLTPVKIYTDDLADNIDKKQFDNVSCNFVPLDSASVLDLQIEPMFNNKEKLTEAKSVMERNEQQLQETFQLLEQKNKEISDVISNNEVLERKLSEEKSFIKESVSMLNNKL